jgi:hypothetical protein
MAEREPVLFCWSGGKDNAMALFLGAVIGNRLLAFVFPLVALRRATSLSAFIF